MQRTSWFHQSVDQPIAHAVTRLWHQSALLDAAFITIAKWTPILMLLTIATAASGIGLPESLDHAAAIAAGTAILTAVLARLANEPISRWIQRERPFEQFPFQPLLSHAKGGGFPSNHTTGAFALAVCMAFIPVYGPCLIVLAVLLMMARVYSGLHYVSDVVAGALHGTFWAMLMTLLVRHFL